MTDVNATCLLQRTQNKFSPIWSLCRAWY